MSSNKCLVVKIEKVNPHPDPKVINLQVANISGFDVLVGKQSFEGEDGLLFLPGAMIPDKIIELFNQYIVREDGKKRTYLSNGEVKVIKLQGFKSWGFFISSSSIPKSNWDELKDLQAVPPGVYWEEKITIDNYAEGSSGKIKRTGREVFKKVTPIGFLKHIDTEQYHSSKGFIKRLYENGGVITVTRKDHGTSARVYYGKAQVNEDPNLGFFKRNYRRLKRLFQTKDSEAKYRHWIGTRNVNQGSSEDPVGVEGYRAISANRDFYGKLEKGETVYYEIVGFDHNGKPIMSPNGDVPYSYGNSSPNHSIKVYKITKNLESGEIYELTHKQVIGRCKRLSLPCVEAIKTYDFSVDEKPWEIVDQEIKEIWLQMDALNENIIKLSKRKEVAESPSALKKEYNHIDEGIVIRVDSENRVDFFKLKTFSFYEAEGKITAQMKELGVEDSLIA